MDELIAPKPEPKGNKFNRRQEYLKREAENHMHAAAIGLIAARQRLEQGGQDWEESLMKRGQFELLKYVSDKCLDLLDQLIYEERERRKGNIVDKKGT